VVSPQVAHAVAPARSSVPHLGHAGASLVRGGASGAVITCAHAGQVDRTASPSIAKLAATSS
jgi:hypothetical protein